VLRVVLLRTAAASRNSGARFCMLCPLSTRCSRNLVRIISKSLGEFCNQYHLNSRKKNRKNVTHRHSQHTVGEGVFARCDRGGLLPPRCYQSFFHIAHHHLLAHCTLHRYSATGTYVDHLQRITRRDTYVHIPCTSM
jgi:hypothetical protein